MGYDELVFLVSRDLGGKKSTAGTRKWGERPSKNTGE